MNWALLLAALMTTEQPYSDGAAARAIRREQAYGPLQIRAACLKDVNTKEWDAVIRKYGRSLLLRDCLQKAIAVWVCRKYLEHYGQVYQLRTGKEPTAEIYVRLWNGGPNGWKNPATKHSWEKVRKILERKSNVSDRGTS